MSDFKFNLFYNNDSNTFQELMNKVFANYFKQQIECEALQKC